MSNRDVLVFDMDGVLAEVGDSYRESIVQTVLHFTGKTISREAIQEYKNQGGWNNDWALSQKICSDFGVEVSYQQVVDYFVEIFFGDGTNGLILREKWIPRDGLLERLGETFELALFTGRLRSEIAPTVQRFAPEVPFGLVVAADDVMNGKPAPDGLLQIARLRPGVKLWYVGDTVDDARSAESAGVPFIGIAAPDVPLRDEVVALLKQHGAIAVLNDVNEIEEVLSR